MHGRSASFHLVLLKPKKTLRVRGTLSFGSPLLSAAALNGARRQACCLLTWLLFDVVVGFEGGLVLKTCGSHHATGTADHTA